MVRYCYWVNFCHLCAARHPDFSLLYCRFGCRVPFSRPWHMDLGTCRFLVGRDSIQSNSQARRRDHTLDALRFVRLFVDSTIAAPQFCGQPYHPLCEHPPMAHIRNRCRYALATAAPDEIHLKRRPPGNRRCFAADPRENPGYRLRPVTGFRKR